MTKPQIYWKVNDRKAVEKYLFSQVWTSEDKEELKIHLEMVEIPWEPKAPWFEHMYYPQDKQIEYVEMNYYWKLFKFSKWWFYVFTDKRYKIKKVWVGSKDINDKNNVLFVVKK
jgi:hypothetical protein